MRKVFIRCDLIVEKRCTCSYSKLIRMIRVNKVLVVSSNWLGLWIISILVSIKCFGIAFYFVHYYNGSGFRLSPIGTTCSWLGVRLIC